MIIQYNHLAMIILVCEQMRKRNVKMSESIWFQSIKSLVFSLLVQDIQTQTHMYILFQNTWLMAKLENCLWSKSRTKKIK